MLEGEAIFAEPTGAAVRKWHWKPATQGGKAIAVYEVIRVPFRLQ